MTDLDALLILDSLVDPIAVLDQECIIRHVNAAWLQLAWRHGSATGVSSSIGVDYFSICKEAGVGPNAEEGRIASAGIHAVLQGKQSEFSLEYPCHSPHEQRWYRLTATPLRGRPHAAVVSHRSIADLKRTEIAGRLSQAMLRQLADEDLLTSLPNRTVLMQRLEKLAERNRIEPLFCFALLLLELDRMMLIEDALGPAAAEELLVAVGERLRRLGVAGSFIARFRDDVFAYVVSNSTGINDAGAVADRLRVALSAPYTIRGRELQSDLNIGIALADLDACDPCELVRNGTIALREAQRTGFGSIILFDQTMHDRQSRRLGLDSALRHALERRELTLRYQPIVDLMNGRMIWAEALPQWCDPEFGEVSPSEFIAVAEQTTLIERFSEWMLQAACRQWTRWQSRDAEAAPSGIVMGLTRIQLAMGDRLLDMVRSVLQDERMPAAALQFDIDEHPIAFDAAGTRDVLMSLRELGVRLSLKTQHCAVSAMTCAAEQPFQSVKFARSFVMAAHAHPLVMAAAKDSVKALDALGLTSIGCGIDDAGEVAILCAVGCRCGQGNAFGRPLPADMLVQATAVPSAALPEIRSGPPEVRSAS